MSRSVHLRRTTRRGAIEIGEHPVWRLCLAAVRPSPQQVAQCVIRASPRALVWLASLSNAGGSAAGPLPWTAVRVGLAWSPAVRTRALTHPRSATTAGITRRAGPPGRPAAQARHHIAHLILSTLRKAVEVVPPPTDFGVGSADTGPLSTLLMLETGHAANPATAVAPADPAFALRNAGSGRTLVADAGASGSWRLLLFLLALARLCRGARATERNVGRHPTYETGHKTTARGTDGERAQ